MEISFIIIAALILVSAVAAMALRNLVHCALCLTVTFVGLAAMYLQLDAQFIGFAQILVYVGAVAILILFAILLTRSGETGPTSRLASGWWIGLAVAAAAFVGLWMAIRSSGVLPTGPAPLPEISVKMIGEQLLNRPEGNPESYILPLLVTGVLLTAAMLGAVLIALQERKEK